MIQIFQIILEVSAVLLGLYLALFKSYFEERGKILATKKDIDLITEKVERVKSEIEILTHKKISLSTEKQSALIDFNAKYSAWLNYLMHVSMTNNVTTAENYISKVTETSSQLFYDYIISEARVDVFFNNDHNLINFKDEIKIKTIELSNILDMYLIKAGVEVKCLAIVEDYTDHGKKMEHINNHYKLLFEIIKECQEKKLEQFQKIVPDRWKLVEMISIRVHDFNITKINA